MTASDKLRALSDAGGDMVFSPERFAAEPDLAWIALTGSDEFRLALCEWYEARAYLYELQERVKRSVPVRDLDEADVAERIAGARLYAAITKGLGE